MSSALEKVNELLKKVTGQSQLMSKQDLGSRVLYLYQQPDGSTKQVYRKKKMAKPRVKKEEEVGKERVKKTKYESSFKGLPKGKPPAKGKKTKYDKVVTAKGSTKGFFLGNIEWELIKKEESKSGVGLVWKIYRNKEDKNKEAHVMEGQKFNAIVSKFMLSEDKDQLSMQIHIHNIVEDQVIYKKRITLILAHFLKDPRQYVTEFSFIQIPGDIDEISQWIAAETGDTAADAVNGVEYAIERSFFNKQGKNK